MRRRATDPRWNGYRNRAAGEFGEQLVKGELARRGYRLVERVHTPWKVIFRQEGGRRRVVDAFPVEKVSGDFRAVEPGSGRNVLAEVKTKDTDSLPWSAFEVHQLQALEENHKAGALSLMVWVRNGIVMVYPWPQEGFGPGKSLKPQYPVLPAGWGPGGAMKDGKEGV